MPQYQVQKQPQRRKNGEEEKLMFDPAKVFGPEEAKKHDFDIDLKKDKDSARYAARHGEGGDRKYGSNAAPEENEHSRRLMGRENKS